MYAIYTRIPHLCIYFAFSLALINRIFSQEFPGYLVSIGGKACLVLILTLRSNTKNLLQIPLTNLKRFGDRAFCAYAPRLWNELPDNIKAADSVQNFKKQLKTLLFRKEFN